MTRGRLDFFSMRAKRRNSRPLAGAASAKVVFKRLAADRARDLAFERTRGEEHDIAVEIVSLDLLGKFDQGSLDHAEGIEDREHGRKLYVLLPALEARDGWGADVGNCR